MASFEQFIIQLSGVGVVGLFCVVSSVILILLVKKMCGLRVSE